MVIAPKYIGDIAAISMDGGTEYYVRQEAFLAGSPRLSISRSAKTFGLGLDGLFNYRVKGKGTLAITTYGVSSPIIHLPLPHLLSQVIHHV